MASLGMLLLLATLFVTLFFAGKAESHVPSPYQNEKESMMPKLGMDTQRTWHGYGKNTDFTLKDEVPDVTQHENIADFEVSKYHRKELRRLVNHDVVFRRQMSSNEVPTDEYERAMPVGPDPVDDPEHHT